MTNDYGTHDNGEVVVFPAFLSFGRAEGKLRS